MKTNKGFAKTLLIIIGLLIIGGGAYLYTNRRVDILDPENSLESFSEHDDSESNTDNNQDIEDNISEKNYSGIESKEHDLGLKNFNIDSRKADCNKGNGIQDCLVVNGKIFYDSIEGFDYKEGYLYEIAVEKKLSPYYDDVVSGILADSSIYTYKLLEILTVDRDVDYKNVDFFDLNFQVPIDSKINRYNSDVSPEYEFITVSMPLLLDNDFYHLGKALNIERVNISEKDCINPPYLATWNNSEKKEINGNLFYYKNGDVYLQLIERGTFLHHLDWSRGYKTYVNNYCYTIGISLIGDNQIVDAINEGRETFNYTKSEIITLQEIELSEIERNIIETIMISGGD